MMFAVPHMPLRGRLAEERTDENQFRGIAARCANGSHFREPMVLRWERCP